METLSIEEAGGELAGLLDRLIANGEGMVIERGGSPFAILKPIADVKAAHGTAGGEELLSAACLRAVMDHVPAAISLKDLAGRFVAVNKRYARAIGKDSRDLCGERADSLLAAEDAAHLEAVEERVCKTK